MAKGQIKVEFNTSTDMWEVISYVPPTHHPEWGTLCRNFISEHDKKVLAYSRAHGMATMLKMDFIEDD